MHRRQAAYAAFYVLYNGLMTFAFILLLPFMVYSVITQPKRRFTFRQRMGWHLYPWQQSKTDKRSTSECIWVHALSVGEMLAVQPLVERMHTLHTDQRIRLTASTYSGFQTAERLFGQLDGVDIAYFPYDWLWAVRSVAAKIRPSVVILTETDIWPNFLMEMYLRRVPVYLVNLRLSDGSWNRFKRFKWVARAMFCAFEKIGIQNPQDLRELQSLGVPREKMAVTGNIKFDGIMPSSFCDSTRIWREQLKIPAGRTVIVAGSTHEGEERILMQACTSLQQEGHELIWILAPRDPQRCKSLSRLCKDSGLAGSTLSSLMAAPDPSGDHDVVLVDSFGVLKSLYGLADVAFIGGSLVAGGGHNPLEAAAWSKPILYGPDMRDFAPISKLLLEAHGACQVADGDEMLSAIRDLLSDPASAEAMGRRALKVFQSQQGAVDRTLELIGLGPQPMMPGIHFGGSAEDRDEGQRTEDAC